MSLKNCLPCVPKLPLPAVKRLNVLDRAAYKRGLRCSSVSSKKLSSGEELVLLEKNGPGDVCTLFVELKGSTALAASDSRISIFVDGEESPSVTGTIANLFLSGLEGKAVYGDYAGKTLYDMEGRRVSHYRYLFVPYNSACRIVLKPLDGEFLEDIQASIYYHVDHEGQGVDFGRFGKTYSVEKKGQEWEQDKAVELACIKGKGALHSIQFSLSNPDSAGSFMEGNIEFYIDGNPFPEYQSSGTEEFFMGGVYFMNLHESAYSGCTRSFNDGSLNPEHISTAHRLFVDDPITFEREVRIVWHNAEKGQGCPYAGTTTYDFHAIYYTQSEEIQTISVLKLDEAGKRIDLLDGGIMDLPSRSSSFGTVVVKDTETTLASIEGKGTVSCLYLECSGNDSSAWEEALLSMEVDGKASGTVSLPLFFTNAPGEKKYAGRLGGCTGPGTYYRYLSIPFGSNCTVSIKADTPFEVKGRVEYKEGEAAGFGTFEMTGCSSQLSMGESVELLNIRGNGMLEEVMLDLSGEGALEGQLAIYEAASKNPYILPTDIAAFFLSGYKFAGKAGVSSNVGVLHRSNERVAAFRCFVEDKLAFKSNLRIVFTANKPVTVNSAVMYRLERESVKELNLQNLLQRLNLLDGARDSYYSLCYSAMEDERGEINPGETCILLEDFGPGAIQCIRLGTPPYGRELLAAQFRIYLDGDVEPVVDTTVGRFFSAEFDDAIFWSGSRYISRPSKMAKYYGGGGDHTSVFRYILIPYRKGIKVTMTAPDFGPIKGFMQVYYQGGTGIITDFGRYQRLGDACFEGDVEAGAETEIADITGRGALTSVQFMLENKLSDQYLKGEIAFYVDDEKTPSFIAPTAEFFMGAGKSTPCPEFMEGYSELWKARKAAEGGYFTSAYAGWPCRKTDAPYRSAMYRLFIKDPIVFNQSLKVTWKNSAPTTTKLQSDLLFMLTGMDQ